MKIQKKRLSATIALALTLTIVATLITGLPFTFAQEEEHEYKTGISALIPVQMNLWVGPNPVGVNQQVLIEVALSPRPLGYDSDPSKSEGRIYEDVKLTIVKPDGTNETIIRDTDSRAEIWFWYTPTQQGIYGIYGEWAGDSEHEPATAGSFAETSLQWTVQADAVPELGKMTPSTFLSAAYDVIGVGQTQTVIGWISPPRELNRGIYYDLTFTITKPGGATFTHTRDTLTEATAYIPVLCDETGTWSVKFSYPGNELHNGVESEPTIWTVQEEQVLPEPQQPLPTYEWKFPVSAEFWEWYQITGAWKGVRASDVDGVRGSSFNPYTTAPNTPHVLWAKQLDKAGIMGGETGYFSWEPKYVFRRDTVIEGAFLAFNGRIYYNRPERYDLNGESGTHPVLYCLDQYTGELIYRRDLPGTSGGGSPILEQSMSFKVDPRVGIRELVSWSIWLTSGGLWKIDPWTGNTLYFNDDLSGTYYDLAIYMNNYPEDGYFTKWDTNARDIVWTKEAPVNPWDMAPVFPSDFGEGYGFSRESPRGAIPFSSKLWSWNLTTGDLLADGVLLPEFLYSPGGSARLLQDGKIYMMDYHGVTRAWDVRTGDLVWTSTETADYPWQTFTPYQQASSWGPTGGGRDQLYIPNYDGYVHAFDMANGNELWRAYTTDTLETGFGHHVPWTPIVIADNKVYFGTGEHTPPQPSPRGGQLYCVDAVTGERIWTLDGFMTHVWSTRHYAGASGGMVWYANGNDGKLYMFGKGETATIVEASPKVAANGASVLIEGTVTDQSPGAKGTPAVSDDSQADWMEYLYMNYPMPTDTQGVPVTLQAARSDGTVIGIAVVTTDILGHYEYLWTPPDKDTYKILATFDGSDSYWTSSAECGLGVIEAAGPSGPIEPEPTADYTIAIVAAVVAVVVVALVAVWAIRRRK